MGAQMHTRVLIGAIALATVGCTDSMLQAVPSVPEVCNGLDDDGDGIVDEDHPDTDADGIADCLDRECEVELPPIDRVGANPACGVPGPFVPPPDPWDVTVEWQWDGPPQLAEPIAVMQPPLVVPLTDDDGDGDIDEDDGLDVVVLGRALRTGAVAAIDGATGESLWTTYGFDDDGTIVVADLNGDGLPDVVGPSGGGGVAAVNHDGRPLWNTDTLFGEFDYALGTAVGDLDGDGSVEVVVDRWVLAGEDGSILFGLPLSPFDTVPYRLPTLADLDLDGRLEIVLADRVFDATGTLLWRTALGGGRSVTAAVVDVDDDPQAEVIFFGRGEMVVVDHDGTERLRRAEDTTDPTPSCVADFDGDGVPEIGWAHTPTTEEAGLPHSQVTVAELDGTPLWSADARDFSGFAGCSAFDFDADGRFELLYADETRFAIFDGATGEALYEDRAHASRTQLEYPTIADIDGDGAAEILLGSSDGFTGSGFIGLQALGHRCDAWPPPAVSSWTQHGFTREHPGGGTPATPWLDVGTLRAAPVGETLTPAIDLTVAITDVCWSSCEAGGAMQLVAQVANAGVEATRKDIRVALYAASEDDEVLVDVVTLDAPLAPGAQSPGIVFQAPVEAFFGRAARVVVDDDGSGGELHTECDEGNNVAEEPSPCG